MNKQARQMIVLAVVLVVLGIGYLALRNYNEEQANQPTVDERLALKQLNEEEIVSISYNYGGTDYSFEKGEGTWYSVSDPDLSLKQYPFSTMTSYLAELRVEETIGAVEDITQYGLEKPQMTIEFRTDAESCTVLIGDYNSMAEGYYVCLEGENNVYLVASKLMTVFSYDLEGLTEETTEESTEETTEETIEESTEDVSQGSVVE